MARHSAGGSERLEVHFEVEQSLVTSMAELTIGELSERSGVATSALRFYEERGLIESRRTTGNQRRYGRATLRRVAFIRTAQRVGLTLEEVAEALATLPAGRTPTKADWARLSRSWRPASTSRSAGSSCSATGWTAASAAAASACAPAR